MSIMSALTKPISVMSKNTNMALNNIQDTSLTDAGYPIFSRLGVIIERLITEIYPKLPDSSKVLIYNDIMDILINKRPTGLSSDREIAFVFLKYLIGLESCLDPSFFTSGYNSLQATISAVSQGVRNDISKIKKILADLESVDITAPGVTNVNLGAENLADVEELLNTIGAISTTGSQMFGAASKLIAELDSKFASIYAAPAEVDSNSISDLLNECRTIIASILEGISFLNAAASALPEIKNSFLEGLTPGFAISYINALVRDVFASRIMLDDVLLARSVSSFKIINLFCTVLIDEMKFRMDEIAQLNFEPISIPRISTAILKQDMMELLAMLNQPSSITDANKSRLVSLINGHLEKVEDKLVIISDTPSTYPTWQTLFKSTMDSSSFDNFYEAALFGDWGAISTMLSSEADKLSNSIDMAALLDTKYGNRGPAARMISNMQNGDSDGIRSLAGAKSEVMKKAAASQNSVKAILQNEITRLSSQRLKAPCETLFKTMWASFGENLNATLFDKSLFSETVRDSASAAKTANAFYESTQKELDVFQVIDPMLGELDEMVIECSEIYEDYWRTPVNSGADNTAQCRRFLTELLRFVKSIKERYKVAQWI